MRMSFNLGQVWTLKAGSLMKAHEIFIKSILYEGTTIWVDSKWVDFSRQWTKAWGSEFPEEITSIYSLILVGY